MNIITHSKAYSIYPRGTFINNESLVMNRYGWERQHRARLKWESRGWTMVRALEPWFDEEEWMLGETRRLGDDDCWVIELSPDDNEDGCGALRGVNVLEKCSWKLVDNGKRELAPEFWHLVWGQTRFAYIVDKDRQRQRSTRAEIKEYALESGCVVSSG